MIYDMEYVISVDQSTSATKAFLFDSNCKVVASTSVHHHQYYPMPGWVEQNAVEIYHNTIEAIRRVVDGRVGKNNTFSLAITNQRETVIVWERTTGEPVCRAVVWQCRRGEAICELLKAQGYEQLVEERSGLIIDPYFAGSGAKWILDNIPGARMKAENGELCMGTMDSWLIYKLTNGEKHVTDYTNASRTMLFNIKDLDWDDDLLKMLTIPRSMMPSCLPCDAVFGETTVEGLFSRPIKIAGVLGDSHGALVGQMCFHQGFGKVTYGTGSSVMVNIGEKFIPAPKGIVTSVGFSMKGHTYYAFEGNIHSTGATLEWMKNRLRLVDSIEDLVLIASSVPDNGGVYFVPAFSGLGAPWWNDKVRGVICGLTLASSRAHVCRAALESIGYQVTDLVKSMTNQAHIDLKELRVDGGPTTNDLLMQMQANLLQVPVICSQVQDASAFGALIMNRFSLRKWSTLENAEKVFAGKKPIQPTKSTWFLEQAYKGWQHAVKELINNNNN